MPIGPKGDLRSAAQLADYTSIELIRKVEMTIDALASKSRAIQGVTKLIDLLCQKLKACKPEVGGLIDPDDENIDILQKTYEWVAGEIPQIITREQSIDDDPDLNEDMRESLHEEYRAYLGWVAVYVEALKDLRGAVITHDLAAESREIPSYENVDELFGSLSTMP